MMLVLVQVFSNGSRITVRNLGAYLFRGSTEAYCRLAEAFFPVSSGFWCPQMSSLCSQVNYWLITHHCILSETVGWTPLRGARCVSICSHLYVTSLLVWTTGTYKTWSNDLLSLTVLVPFSVLDQKSYFLCL